MSRILNDKNKSYIQRNDELYRITKRDFFGHAYRSYTKTAEIPQLILDVARMEANVVEFDFKMRHALIPNLQGLDSRLMKSYIECDTEGNEIVFNPEELYRRPVWRTTSGYYVGIFDKDNADELETSFVSGSLKDKKGRWYNPKTHEMRTHLCGGISDIGFITLNNNDKNDNKADNEYQLHINKLSKLLTDSNYAEKVQLTQDSFYGGIGMCDNKNFELKVQDNGVQSNILDRMLILDMDNVNKVQEILMALCELKFAPSMILLKNNNSKNPGSCHVVYTFTNILSKADKEKIRRLLTCYIIHTRQCITFDYNYGVNSKLYQNPFQANDVNLLHNVYIKSDYELYDLENVIKELEGYDIDDDDFKRIESLSHDKRYLISNSNISDLISIATNNQQSDTSYKFPYAWEEYVPEGSRNNTLSIEILQCINLAIAAQGESEIENFSQYDADILKDVMNRMKARVADAYENNDHQMNDKYIMSRIKSWMKSIAEESSGTRRNSVLHACNIAKATNYNALLDKPYDTKDFDVSTNTRSEKQLTISRQKGVETNKLMSLVVGIGNLVLKDEINTMMTAAKNNTFAKHFAEIDAAECSSLRSGYVKAYMAFKQYHSASKLRAFLHNKGVKYPISSKVSTRLIDSDKDYETLKQYEIGINTTASSRVENAMLAAHKLPQLAGASEEEVELYVTTQYMSAIEGIIRFWNDIFSGNHKIVESYISESTGYINYRATKTNNLKKDIQKYLYYNYGLNITELHILLKDALDFNSNDSYRRDDYLKLMKKKMRSMTQICKDYIENVYDGVTNMMCIHGSDDTCFERSIRHYLGDDKDNDSSSISTLMSQTLYAYSEQLSNKVSHNKFSSILKSFMLGIINKTISKLKTLLDTEYDETVSGHIKELAMNLVQKLISDIEGTFESISDTIERKVSESFSAIVNFFKLSAIDLVNEVEKSLLELKICA